MKCVHTLRTGRYKHQADITLLFQYIILLGNEIVKARPDMN